METLSAQPERLLYFKNSVRTHAALDPGQELLDRNLLISNQTHTSNVSFELSFNKNDWSGFALGPLYSSMYSLQGNNGCYIRVRTYLGQDIREIIYFLLRGKCYSVYWNTIEQRWDIVENPCRR